MVKRRDRRAWAALGVIAASAAFASGPGCTENKGSSGGLLLVIAQDEGLGVDRIRVEIASKGTVLKQSEYRLPAEADLPTSLAIGSNGDPAASVQITIIAWRGDVPVDRRDNVVERIPTDRVAALAVVLSARCASLVVANTNGVTSRCNAGETCNPGTGACSANRVSAVDLPTATTIEGALGALDSGLAEAAANEAGPDANKPETGGDGGPVDNYATAILADGPRAYFRFEEASGPACKNEGSDVSVSCVYSSSGISFGVPGTSGRKGARLDVKTAQINVFGGLDYVGTTPFTVEALVNFDPVSADDMLFTAETSGATPRHGRLMGLLDLDSRVRSELWVDGGLVFYTLSKSPPVAKAWTHIVYGYSPAAGKDFLYVDGALGAGFRTGPGEHVAPPIPMSWTNGAYSIDDLAIYSKELTPAQIAAHYLAR